MKGALFWALKLSKEIPDSSLTSQFETKYNAKIHYETTGPEIWSQTQGKVDYFVSGGGTGGTLVGTSTFLLEKSPAVKIIAVEPVESPVLGGGKPGPHKIQGMGAGFVPKIIENARANISEIITVSSEDALTMSRKLPTMSGVFCGISGGAIVKAAVEIAKRPEAEGKLIVAIIPSFGERYLTTVQFDALRVECLNMPVLGVENFP